MKILGLDPGIARTGFGIVETTGHQHTFITCGILTTPPDLSDSERLYMLGQDLETVVKKFQPEQVVIEAIFFGNNKKTAVITAQARGVLLYILEKHTIPVTSLTPLQIKSRLTGYGSASKEQVQAIVTQQLHLTEIPQPDDAADALAATLCI